MSVMRKKQEKECEEHRHDINWIVLRRHNSKYQVSGSDELNV